MRHRQQLELESLLFVSMNLQQSYDGLVILESRPIKRRPAAPIFTIDLDVIQGE